jgi:hypothetical protein
MRAFERTFVLFVFLLPLHARAASWVSDSSFGADPKSCHDILRDRQENAELANRDVEWMFGFLTALVRSEGASGKGGLTAEDFEGEIQALCRAHPQTDIGSILESFAENHDLIMPKSGR